jgi:hypothetical protein
MLFVPAVHISHTQPSLLQLLQSLNTFIQVNIMGARLNMKIHTHTHTRFTAFLLVLLLDHQAGHLAPDAHVGNTYYQDVIDDWKRKIFWPVSTWRHEIEDIRHVHD